MANEGFNTFILGQTAATSAAGTDSFPLIQGGETKNAPVSTITSYNVVGPTGSDDTAMLNSTFANAASRPVMLSFGQYNVTGPLIVPDAGVVLGAGEINVASDYWHTSLTPRVSLVVNETNSFTNGQAVINLGNYSSVSTFSIFGARNFTGHALVNGVNVGNHAYPMVDNLYIVLCYDGINCVSDGSVAGGSPWGNNSIGAVFRRCLSSENENCGFEAWSLNGGFCSDQEISDCWFSANNAISVSVGSGWGNARIVNCRIEDQGAGLIIQNTGQVLVSSCLFDRNSAPIQINNSSNISLVGCISASAGNDGSGSGGTGTHVFFGQNNVGPGGNCSNIQLAGNTYNIGAATTSYTYGVDSGGGGVTVSGAIYESGLGNTALYQNSYSQGIISPLVH
jgi:hypothetical protein